MIYDQLVPYGDDMKSFLFGWKSTSYYKLLIYILISMSCPPFYGIWFDLSTAVKLVGVIKSWISHSVFHSPCWSSFSHWAGWWIRLDKLACIGVASNPVPAIIATVLFSLAAVLSQCRLKFSWQSKVTILANKCLMSRENSCRYTRWLQQLLLPNHLNNWSRSHHCMHQHEPTNNTSSSHHSLIITSTHQTYHWPTIYKVGHPNYKLVSKQFHYTYITLHLPYAW